MTPSSPTVKPTACLALGPLVVVSGTCGIEALHDHLLPAVNSKTNHRSASFARRWVVARRAVGLAIVLHSGVLFAATNVTGGDAVASAPFVFPHRVPSRGLEWSRARYPEQYTQENIVTNSLRGLDDRENERFLDVACRAYSREYVTGFSYTNHALAHPTVELSYCRRAETFTGRLQARGLKPNFAYQIKLCGDVVDDRVAFERIGRLGRWRRMGRRGTNYTDADFDAAPDKSVFESYIFCDYFATDGQGNADKEFYLDSTLHVLFNQPNQGSPTLIDTRRLKVAFSNSSSWVYANPKPSVPPQWVYAQSEAGLNGQIRPAVGEAFLPPGLYRAKLALVEETFHGYGDGGYWPTVMECPVDFEVANQATPPSPLWPSGLPKGDPVPFVYFSGCDSIMLNVTTNTCTFKPDGGAVYPRLILTNAVPLQRGWRHIVVFQVKTDKTRSLYLSISSDRQLRNADNYRIPTVGRSAWQRFEVEVTLPGDPEQVYLSFSGTPGEWQMDLRDLFVTAL